MPSINRHRPPKYREASQSTQWSAWSEYEWNSDQNKYQRYRFNYQTEEYQYDVLDSELDGTASTALPSQPYAGMSKQQFDQTSTVPGDDSHLEPSYGYYNSKQLPSTFLPDGTANQDASPFTSLAADPSPGPWPMAYSNSDPKTTTQPNPDLDIVIYDISGTPHPHTALMDTGAGSGLWIAHRIVESLGWPINTQAPEKRAKVANDQMITSQGQVELTWKVVPSGIRTQKNTFNIWDSKSFDVILGMDYLREMEVVAGFNITKLMPLAPAAAESSYHQAKRQQAEQEQQQGIVQSEARKKKSEGKKADKRKDYASGSSSTQRKK